MIPPSLSVSAFMGYLKGKSALMMFDRHANLKYKFGNRHFWSEGYYVSTVGLNDATVASQKQSNRHINKKKQRKRNSKKMKPFEGLARVKSDIRSTNVVYDRAFSAFSLSQPSEYHWEIS